MSRFISVASLLLVVPLIASCASADQRPPLADHNPYRGFAGAPLSFLRAPIVQEELRMDARQIAQVPALVAQYQDSLRLTSSFNASAKDRKVQQEIHAKLEDRYDDLLTPEQWVRLRQIMYQELSSSDYLLDDPLLTPLQLSEQQLEEIAKINDRFLQHHVQGLSDLKDPRAMQVRNDTMDQVFDVLTPKQQAQFRQLAGNVVDRDVLHLQMQEARTWQVQAVPSSFRILPASP